MSKRLEKHAQQSVSRETGGAGQPERGGIEAIAFTDRGEMLAEKLMDAVGGRACRSGQPDSLRAWTEKHFPSAKVLIFVGAAGIAVRAIVPWVNSKVSDPAVIVIDERGRNVIPILSGHLGGANDLAADLARICGGRCVLTTATDINGVFAVDEWAKRQNCAILEPERIKNISGSLLGGETKTVRSRWPIAGTLPDGLMMTGAEEADIVLDIRPTGEKAIHLVPRICRLGIGCRRGTRAEDLEAFLQQMLRDTGIHETAIAGAATIDIKGDEKGLLQFCENHSWPLQLFDAPQLEQASGSFHGSEFVAGVTGVDNVCERSAVLASEGELIVGKTAGGGMTMALAQSGFQPDWEWSNE